MMLFNDLLLIDDDEDDQDIFLTAIQSISTSVKSKIFDNGVEALEQLSAKVIIPDVIFLDLNMPLMNGQQFLVEIKKNSELKHIPVIIFSTSSHHATKQLMKDLGAHDFITKPDRFDELVNLLKPLFT
ncbi:MAG: response regulator [Bacteroidota bacterium]